MAQEKIGITADNIRGWVAEQNENFTPAGRVPRWTEFPERTPTMLLTCMDPRINPHEIWPTKTNPIGIVRNAGGRAPEFLRSAEALTAAGANGRQQLKTVAVMHHTDCGLLNFDNAAVREKLISRNPDLTEDQIAELKAKDFGELGDIDESVRIDMRLIKADPYLPKDLDVIGFVYDSFTGKAYEVTL